MSLEKYWCNIVRLAGRLHALAEKRANARFKRFTVCVVRRMAGGKKNVFHPGYSLRMRWAFVPQVIWGESGTSEAWKAAAAHTPPLTPYQLQTLVSSEGIFHPSPSSLLLWIIVSPSEVLMDAMNWTHLISLPVLWVFDCVCGCVKDAACPGHGRWFITLRQLVKASRCTAPCPRSWYWGQNW